MAKIRHFLELFNFYLILDYYKIRTKKKIKNPNDKVNINI